MESTLKSDDHVKYLGWLGFECGVDVTFDAILGSFERRKAVKILKKINGYIQKNPQLFDVKFAIKLAAATDGVGVDIGQEFVDGDVVKGD